MDKDSKIFVTGHRGMVGSALVRRLQAGGYTRILTAGRSELDLLDSYAVHDFLAREKPDYLFIAAARWEAFRRTTSSEPISFIRI